MNKISAGLLHTKINPIIEVLGLSQSCQYVNHRSFVLHPLFTNTISLSVRRKKTPTHNKTSSSKRANKVFVPSIVYWPQCCSTAACMFQFRLESSGCGYGRRQAQCILGVVGFLLFACHKLFCLPNLAISKTIAQYWKRGVLLLTGCFFLTKPFWWVTRLLTLLHCALQTVYWFNFYVK